ncbi:MAG TPA: HhH-GPD-type base excision DNA repair protein [Actinocatenispora sp.]
MGVHLAGEPAADELLSSSPLALLIGMLLDQQVPMEVAFAGPAKIADRLGAFDVASIADAEPESFAALCATPPAVHRFPGSMAKRIQALCQYLAEEYDGVPEALWTRGDPSGAEVLRRLKQLPGYGDQKARIFLALLGKQFDVRPAGWREAAGAYGEEGSRRSIADVVDDASLAEVRAYKKEMKAAAKQR